MKVIRNSFYLVFILCLLSACVVTQKQRSRFCSNCPVKKERYDSIVEKLVEVKVPVPGQPGPTVYLENPCKLLCDSLGNLKPVNITTHKNGQKLHINTQGGGLNITAETKDTTATARVKQKEVYAKSHDESVKYIPCVNERTAIDGAFRWWSYITMPLCLLWLAWQLYFKRFFPPKPKI